MLLIMVEVTKIITKNSESQNLDMYIFTLMWHIYRFFVVVVTFFSVIFIMNNCYAFIHAVGSCLTYKWRTSGFSLFLPNSLKEEDNAELLDHLTTNLFQHALMYKKMFERIFICKDQPCFVFYPFNPWGHHLYSIISYTQGGEALFVTITAFRF